MSVASMVCTGSGLQGLGCCVGVGGGWACAPSHAPHPLGHALRMANSLCSCYAWAKFCRFWPLHPLPFTPHASCLCVYSWLLWGTAHCDSAAFCPWLAECFPRQQGKGVAEHTALCRALVSLAWKWGAGEQAVKGTLHSCSDVLGMKYGQRSCGAGPHKRRSSDMVCNIFIISLQYGVLFASQMPARVTQRRCCLFACLPDF